MYAGIHWSKRKEVADRAHQLIRTSPYSGNDIIPFEVPVHITYTVYFDKRPMDADNCCVKIYTDGLRGWCIEDDNPKYVSGVTVYSRVDREHPRIEILIQSE